MKPKKIYSSDFNVVRKFSEDIGLGNSLCWIQGNLICGYCQSANSVQVFCKNSYVDLSEDYEDVTTLYIKKDFKL